MSTFTKTLASYVERPFINWWKIALLVQGPSAALAIVGVFLVDTLAPVKTSEVDPAIVLSAVILAPILETLGISILASILLVLRLNLSAIAVIQAVLWGLLHGQITIIAFAPAAWAFFIFSYVYMLGKSRSFWIGFGLTATIHSVCNAVVLIALAVVFLE